MALVHEHKIDRNVLPYPIGSPALLAVLADVCLRPHSGEHLGTHEVDSRHLPHEVPIRLFSVLGRIDITEWKVNTLAPKVDHPSRASILGRNDKDRLGFDTLGQLDRNDGLTTARSADVQTGSARLCGQSSDRLLLLGVQY